MKKAPALALLQDPAYTKTDEFFFNAGISTVTRRGILDHALLHHYQKEDFKSIIHDLIRLRNRILKAQKDFHTHNCVNYHKFIPSDYGKLFKYLNQICKSPDYTIYKVWDIKRHEISDECDSALSEEDASYD